MKYTSIITAAAVLSASTFAAPFQAKFSVGVEGSHFSLEGERKIGTTLTEANIGAVNDTTLETTATTSSNAVGGTKNLVALKVAANMKMSDRFSLEASAVMSSGTLELLTHSDALHIDAGTTATNALHGHTERLTLKIKPTYGFGVKALFGFNDSFQIGPEVRLQRFENTPGGKIRTGGMEALGTYSVTSGKKGGDDAVTTAPTIFGTGNTVLDGTDGNGTAWAANGGVQTGTITLVAKAAETAVTTNTDGTAVINLNGQTLRADENATIYTVDTKKTTQTETAFGVAMVGKLNDKLSVTAGYNMATAKQHEFKVDATMTADASRMVGSSTAVDKFNLETKKPKAHTTYAGVQFSF